MLLRPWWNDYVAKIQRRSPLQAQPVDIRSLLLLAMQNSNQIRIAATEPMIRHSVVEQMDADFDWIRYFDGTWNDTSEPTGSTLTAGTTTTNFNDHQLSGTGGFRKRTRAGGQLDLSQQLGWQDNNSDFLNPPNQATSRLTLSYTHPLLRGRGYDVNNSVVVLAQIDAGVAENEFEAELQQHFVDVIQTYWQLYLQRSIAVQQVKLLQKTATIVNTIAGRQRFDAQRTQFVSANAALESSKSRLLQTQMEISNAEAELRGLINAQQLYDSQIELLTVEMPSIQRFPVDRHALLQMAIENRPEVKVARQQIEADMMRIGVARNEILPQLDLITQGFLSGLQGESDFIESIGDQFSEGAPSYSIGINYEFALGNRAARSQLSQRELELHRRRLQYQQVVEQIKNEVAIAIRETETRKREIVSNNRFLQASEEEAKTLQIRWERLLDRGDNSGLNLEALLRAQERVSSAERALVISLVDYNLAIVGLMSATGTLLQTQNNTGNVLNQDIGGAAPAVLPSDEVVFDRRSFSFDPTHNIRKTRPRSFGTNSDFPTPPRMTRQADSSTSNQQYSANFIQSDLVAPPPPIEATQEIRREPMRSTDSLNQINDFLPAQSGRASQRQRTSSPLPVTPLSYEHQVPYDGRTNLAPAGWNSTNPNTRHHASPIAMPAANRGARPQVAKPQQRIDRLQYDQFSSSPDSPFATLPPNFQIPKRQFEKRGLRFPSVRSPGKQHHSNFVRPYPLIPAKPLSTGRFGSKHGTGGRW